MGVETGTAIMIASALAAGAGTYAASEQNSAQKSAKSASEAAESKAAAQAAEAAALPQKQAEAAQAAAQEVLKKRAARTKTLLTSSMGVLSEATTQKKTLLGS